MNSFLTLPLSSELLQVIAELGYEHMTPIQEKSLPALLEGRDLIGQSKTGSGKTAAFSIPILQKLSDQIQHQKLNLQKDATLRAVILCPTRELCTQVASEIRKLGRKHMGLQVLVLSGGRPLRPQALALEKGIHIVVGTPGRVLDHLTKKTLSFSHVSTLVLDEADRMLEMGFQEEMESILKEMPVQRQTLFFSATFPHSIEAMSKLYQKNALRITIEDESSRPLIEQHFAEVEGTSESSIAEKLKTLLWLLAHYEPESSIVFCNFKTVVTALTRELKKLKISADALHGDLEQSERDRVMAKFRNKSIRIMIATDVAARGIDIEDLDLVFNFELPQKVEIYTHRIGRTGRAGKRGLAVSLVTQKELSKIHQIESQLEVKMTAIEVDDLKNTSVEFLKKELRFESKMSTLFIAGGRKNKMRPGDLLGALTGEAGGLQGNDIGKIEIHDFFSYVAVASPLAKKALLALQAGRIKGKRFRVEMAN